MPLPHLVIHFDVNETIICSDPAGGDTVADCLHKAIAKTLLIKIDDEKEGRCILSDGTNLDDVQGILSVEDALGYLHSEWQPISGMETYYKSSFKRNVRTWNTHPHGLIFSDLKKYLEEGLKVTPGVSLGDSLCKDGKSHFIFPAFFNAIKRLSEDCRDFTIVIRTFGDDLDDVIGGIDAFATGNHPLFSDFKDTAFEMEETWKKLKFSWADDGTFEVSNEHRTINNDDELLAVLQNGPKIIGIQDDYQFWRKSGYKPCCGKPVFIEEGTKFHHILFDDNIHNDPNDSIVAVRAKRGGKWEALSGQETTEQHGKHLVRVHTIRAILDLDYFYNKIQECEASLQNESYKG